ncbi:MAG: DNA recombination protein RmuC [Gammaproteobacteria bacterium]|nr:DNA recombination protein RmuC [Gammaproteobacteria bacterium]
MDLQHPLLPWLAALVPLALVAALVAALAVFHGRARRDAQRALERLEASLEQARDRQHEQAHALRALATQMDRMDQHLAAHRGELTTALERGFGANRATQIKALGQLQNHLIRQFAALNDQVKSSLADYEQRAERRDSHGLKVLHDSLSRGTRAMQEQVSGAVKASGEAVSEQVDRLTRSTDERLRDISGQVEKRLAEGFEKTTAVFADVQQRLALIDEAQKRITELSSNVVSLQEVLSDKRSRGAMGEVQLSALVGNVMPEGSYALQHTLPNNRRVDCILFLPDPTGHVAVDSKFPLESWQRMMDETAPEAERQAAGRQFKQDVKRHIKDIAERYILPTVTADGAVMFIPAEAVFAEIQAHHPDLVELSYRSRVWMCSPTTMMAVLNTARAVLKDDATRRQVHIIQDHLSWLGRDFERFRKRMDNLARHIGQAHSDVKDVHISAGKIAERFERIEKVELEGAEEAAALPRAAPGSGDGA